jgi:Molecular chaperone, HSP90 family
MNNTDKFKPIIGKNVIENLTIGMYDDPRFVYREYVQNAADQIDAAKRQNLYQSGNESSIYIQINKEAKNVIIEDNAAGIESEQVLPLLGNIAQSTKNKYEDRGFRGIGRLGGLGYCEKLIFETSFYGEDKKSTMTWNAKQLKEIINDDKVKIGAAELISLITDYSFEDTDKNSHYFRVIMENVTNDILLDIQQVRDYLSMVAPVPFANHFTHKNKIYEKAKNKNIFIDDYNIYVNTDQLFKGYNNYIYRNNAISEEDTIIDVVFFEEYYKEELLFWGWYGISSEMHQIPDENKSRGIRLRKSNIQIGLENRLDEFHKEDLGNRYFIGEVYAMNKDLIPNARRDFFIDNDECSQFSKRLRELFYSQLHKLYYDFSKKNAAIKAFQDFENINQKLEDKTIDDTSKSKLETELKKVEKKIVSAKKTLATLENKYEGQVLGNIIKSIDFDIQQETDKQPQQKNNQNAIVKKSFSQKEEDILKNVYSILRKNLIKATAEELIQKIEEEIRQ